MCEVDPVPLMSS